MVNDQAWPGAGEVHSSLRRIIAEHGIDVIGDRDRIRALLQESPALAPRETLALAEAAGLGIPAELDVHRGQGQSGRPRMGRQVHQHDVV